LIKTKNLVVLLHGVGRTSLSMRPIEKALLKQDYAVLNIRYPSRSSAIAKLAKTIHQQLQDFPQFEQFKVHFVTHSMGGLIVRAILQALPLENVQRIVMLGPPNQGSEVADFFKDFRLFNIFYGPALKEMTTERASSLPLQQMPSRYQLGIIAGNFTIDPFCYFILPSGNDGKVTIERTKLPGMTDHIVLSASHSFMMYNNQVIRQISHFLAEGRFLHADNALSKHVK
jgi:pimeloyl-ACP methyl ester carboxylesterase